MLSESGLTNKAVGLNTAHHSKQSDISAMVTDLVRHFKTEKRKKELYYFTHVLTHSLNISPIYGFDPSYA